MINFLVFLMAISSAERLRMVTELLDSVLTVRIIADSALCVDTCAVKFQTYVTNHGGSGGISAGECSDSCDKVRDVIRDTTTVFWNDSIPQATIWTRITGKPSVYPPDAHNQNISTINYLLDSLSAKLPLHGSADSLNHFGSARFTDTTRFKLDSVRMKDSLVIKLAISRFTADSVRLNDSCTVKLGLNAQARNAKDADSLGHYAPARFTDTTRHKACSTATHNRIVSDSTNAFELTARKGIANGYAGLGSPAYVPTAQLGSGVASASTYLCGNQTWATPAGGSGGPAMVKLTADQAFTAVARANVTGLSFAVTSGVYYHYIFYITFRTAAVTTGIKLCLTYPAVTAFSSQVRMEFATDGAGGEWQGALTATTDSVMSTGVQAATTDYFAVIEGNILPSANGTLQVQCGTEIAASAATIRQGTIGFLYTAP